MKVKVVILVCGLAGLAALGIFLFSTPSSVQESSGGAADGLDLKQADLPNELMEKRGPRPDTGRLRDGARQVEDKVDALKVAQEALQRVEKEIAATSDQTTLEKLNRKKQLIEKSIAHLSGGS